LDFGLANFNAELAETAEIPKNGVWGKGDTLSTRVSFMFCSAISAISALKLLFANPKFKI